VTRLILLLALLLAAPAFAQTEEDRYRAVFSAASLGEKPASAQLAIAFTLQYRGLMPHAAFALARDAEGRSAWGFVGGLADAAAAEAGALERCRRALGTLVAECRILARDGVLAAGGGVPPASGAIGPFRAAPLLLRRGPAEARGVLVWGHGYGGPDRDNRNVATPAFVSILNDAGWDVLRFDRHPGDDALYTSLPRLTAGLPALRQAGYRRIILGGQSRGGWQSIMAGSERPELVEAVVATAPAAHGEWTRGNNLGAGLDDFRRLLAGLPRQGPRLAIALFEGDDFDPDPERRADMVATLAAARPAPTVVIFPAQDIRGHGGGGDWRFARLFGGCVLGLVQAPDAAAPRGLRRAPCGGG